jgi:hypothetical protein
VSFLYINPAVSGLLGMSNCRTSWRQRRRVAAPRHESLSVLIDSFVTTRGTTHGSLLPPVKRYAPPRPLRVALNGQLDRWRLYLEPLGVWKLLLIRQLADMAVWEVVPGPRSDPVKDRGRKTLFHFYLRSNPVRRLFQLCFLKNSPAVAVGPLGLMSVRYRVS